MFARGQYTLTLAPSAFGFSLGSFQRATVSRENLASALPQVSAWLKRSLTTLVDRQAFYFVLMDDLDSAWNADDAVARHRLVGLLVAARNVRVWAVTAGLPFTPVIFLRSDIYAALVFPNKNKVTETVARIAWSDDQSGDTSLKKLIDERITASIGYSTQSPWEELFNNDLINGQHLFDFMVGHTHLRPRDMIKLANECLRCAKAAGAERIGADHVLAAMQSYSTYLLGEIDDVAQQAHPEWDSCLMTLRRLGRRTFTRAAFMEAHGTGPDKDADQALRSLYKNGVVGYEQRGSNVFSYRADAALDIGAPKFAIHPGLYEALGAASQRPAGGTDHAATS